MSIWHRNWIGGLPEVEIWRPVEGYRDYQVSSHGNVRSFKKRHFGKNLKPFSTGDGYLTVLLSNETGSKCKMIHTLMSDAFLGICSLKGFITDHIDNVKTNNRIDNLQRITKRENNAKDHKRSGKYPGISKEGNYWVAQMYIGGKRKYLGSSKSQEEAHSIYANAVKELTYEKI